MTDHLPECHMRHGLAATAPCICPALRACEQRVRDEMRQPDPGINESAAYARAEGFGLGVQAARDAVAALPHEDGCCSKGCACRTWDKQEPCDLSCNCSFWWMPHALAAIDALRGES